MNISLIIVAVGAWAFAYPPGPNAPSATEGRGAARIHNSPLTKSVPPTSHVASLLVGDEKSESAPPTRGDAKLFPPSVIPSRVAGLASCEATATRASFKQRKSSPSPHSTAARSTAGTSDSTDLSTEPIAVATRGVVGSKHDFSKLTGRPLDTCAACHVPHILAVTPTTGRGGQTALAFYRLGGQREVLVPDRYMPGPASLICLSCHNGTVATSTIGSSHAMMAGVREGFDIPSAVASRDHPIGIEYPAGGKGFRPRAMVEAQRDIRLPEGRLECVSCHNPHNTAGVEKMLVKSNRRSALCLSCHVK